jgi:hypothetical protein
MTTELRRADEFDILLVLDMLLQKFESLPATSQLQQALLLLVTNGILTCSELFNQLHHMSLFP